MKRFKLMGITLVLCLALSITISGCELIDSVFGGGDSGDGDMGLMSVSPTEGLVNEILDISITGQSLSNEVSPNLVAKLINGATVVTGVDVNVITGGQVIARFTLPQTPMVMSVATSDDDGDEGSLTQVFTVKEYEIMTPARTVPINIDISGGDVSYDFSDENFCVTSSPARDVTFTLDAGNPAITVTTGGTGGIYPYQPALSSLVNPSNLQARISSYARDGDSIFPRRINAGDYYGLLNVGVANSFIVLYVNAVDAAAGTADVNFMIVRMIELNY